MARPKVIDYDPASDETIVTAGVEGARLTWFGIDPDRQIIHIVCEEGTLTVSGDGIDTATRTGQQMNLEDADFVDFYVANKTTIDEIARVALLKFAELKGKTGVVIET